MYWLEVDDPTEYDTVEVDDRIFYCRKEKEALKKRRYSDQFKDPLFKTKDIYRRLRMLEQFMDKNDLEELTGRYREIIVECSVQLSKEFGVPLGLIYKHFKLERFEISADEFS